MNSDILNDFFIHITNKGFKVDSVHFISNEADIFLGCNSLVNIHSAAKTFVSLAFGIAMEKYKIDVYRPIIDYFPEYRKKASNGTEKIRIIDLLHMQSGKRMRSLLQKSGRSLWDEDWLSWFFEAPLDFIPGTQFCYSSHSCYVIGRLIEKVSGQDVNDFLDKPFWSQLGIDIPDWSKCPKGYSNGAGNLILTCKDFSKIGVVLLNHGFYYDKYTCSPDYISLVTSNIVNSSGPFKWNDYECQNGYGFFIWKCSRPNTYCAWGAGGNFCVINYNKGYVLTITAIRDDVWQEKNDHEILHSIWKLIDSKIT